MAVDDYLRVAWQADRDGNRQLREAMLTLAVAFSPGEAWAELCRARLVQDRPSHFLGHHPTLPEALADPRVQHSLRKLRARNPLSRVRFLRLRSEASTGLLLYHEPLGEMSKARLKVIRETTDGFRIAEEDLKLRGEGDVLGIRQSGLPGYRIARSEVHGQLITQARDEALRIMKDNPKLKGERGEALRCLLYLYERDEAIPLIGAG